ncbi:transposable element Tcb2 transposase [Trichonephila clavipes]|nr:transposable element Tcb2 transposase [Trichonephila clavipes]
MNHATPYFARLECVEFDEKLTKPSIHLGFTRPVSGSSGSTLIGDTFCWHRSSTLGFFEGGVGTSESERCHSHEDQAQDALNKPVVDKTTTSDESRFSLSGDGNRIRVWRPRGERLNQAFDLQRHSAPTAGVMVWGVIAYNTRSPLVLIRGTMTAKRNVHDILQPHVLPLMQRLQAAIFQQDNARPHTARVSQNCFRTVTTLPWSADPQICLQASISGIIWDGELGIPRV